MKSEEEERLIAHAVTRLSAKYPSVSADIVAQVVASVHAHFDGHRCLGHPSRSDGRICADVPARGRFRERHE
ncbi:three-helix bundle dimerization domain-containing protein [Rhodococcus globerulus]|uniref:three-helix bundle dimerization domain-containing protein n=1 Tax=Rhodococcus globerulus TaxID=33008 RepID=UPI003AFAB6E4